LTLRLYDHFSYHPALSRLFATQHIPQSRGKKRPSLLRLLRQFRDVGQTSESLSPRTARPTGKGFLSTPLVQPPPDPIERSTMIRSNILSLDGSFVDQFVTNPDDPPTPLVQRSTMLTATNVATNPVLLPSRVSTDPMSLPTNVATNNSEAERHSRKHTPWELSGAGMPKCKRCHEQSKKSNSKK